MPRMTVNFSKEYEQEYEKLIKESSSSKVVCEAIKKYYFEQITKPSDEDIMEKLNLILDKIDKLENKED